MEESKMNAALTVTKDQNDSAGSSNSSTVFALWNASTTVSLVCTITGFVLNALLLLLFAVKRELRTPFNIYLINLLLANVSLITVQYTLDIENSLLPSGWPFGESLCTLYLYSRWTLEACLFNAHQLIALNRLWALVYPLSYRTRHTSRMAFMICVAMWVYAHAATLPMIVLDALYYRRQILENGCYFNIAAQYGYAFALNVVLVAWPEVVIWIAFPVVVISKFKRILKRRRPVGPLLNHSGTTGSSASATTRPTRPTVSRDVAVVVQKGMTLVSSAVQRTRSTLVLGLLTLAITFCWTPIIVCIFCALLVPGYLYTHGTFLFTSVALFSIQTTIDPIVFMLALPDLRRAIREVFSR